MFKITILKINKIGKDHFREDFSVAMTSQFKYLLWARSPRRTGG